MIMDKNFYRWYIERKTDRRHYLLALLGVFGLGGSYYRFNEDIKIDDLYQYNGTHVKQKKLFFQKGQKVRLEAVINNPMEPDTMDIGPDADLDSDIEFRLDGIENGATLLTGTRKGQAVIPETGEYLLQIGLSRGAFSDGRIVEVTVCCGGMEARQKTDTHVKLYTKGETWSHFFQIPEINSIKQNIKRDIKQLEQRSLQILTEERIKDINFNTDTIDGTRYHIIPLQGRMLKNKISKMNLPSQTKKQFRNRITEIQTKQEKVLAGKFAGQFVGIAMDAIVSAIVDVVVSKQDTIVASKIEEALREQLEDHIDLNVNLIEEYGDLQYKVNSEIEGEIEVPETDYRLKMVIPLILVIELNNKIPRGGELRIVDTIAENASVIKI